MSKTMIMDHPLDTAQGKPAAEQKHRHQRIQGACVRACHSCCAMRPRGICPPKRWRSRRPSLWQRRSVLSGRKLALVPILRAGLGMVDGMLALIPRR